MKFSEVTIKISKLYHDYVLAHRSDPIPLYRLHSDALEHALNVLATDSRSE